MTRWSIEKNQASLCKRLFQMNRTIMTAVLEAKVTLRKELKKKLVAMTDDERNKQSKIIANKLFSLSEYQASQRLCLYLHMKEEVETLDILKHAMALNKECFIPQYIGPNMKMVKLYSMEDYKRLPETRWKIKQPGDDDDRPDALEKGGLDLILMPGLGFTLEGDRLGRGKGYYDSYLQKCHKRGFKPRTIALAYSQQICKSIPVSETDVKVDFILHPQSEDPT